MKPSVVKPEYFDSWENIALRQYAYYDWETDLCACELDGNWFRMGIEFTPREWFDDEIEAMKANKSLTGVKGSYKTMNPARIGTAATFSYVQEGVPQGAEMLYISEGSRVLVLRCYFHAADREDARDEIFSIVKSLEVAGDRKNAQPRAATH